MAYGLNQFTPIVYPWTPDLGDGTYQNPIICADYSDPDAIRDGDDFYMTASSFVNTPGLPILHSKDLVNWTLINHAVENLPGAKFEKVHAGCGVWARRFGSMRGCFGFFFQWWMRGFCDDGEGPGGGME